MCQLRPRLDAELSERLMEVVLDGGGADEKLCGNLTVRVALRGQSCNLYLLWRELIEGLDRTATCTLTRGFQFDACACGERLHAGSVEEVMRCPQLFPGIEAPAMAPQPFAEKQARTRDVNGHTGPTEVIYRIEVQGFRVLIVREERFGTRGCSECPVRRAHARHLRKTSAR